MNGGMNDISVLHDYELMSVNSVSRTAEITIELMTPDRKPAALTVSGMTSMSLTREESRGRGTYIASADMTDDSKGHVLDIQLNSGDELIIAFTGQIVLH